MYNKINFLFRTKVAATPPTRDDKQKESIFNKHDLFELINKYLYGRADTTHTSSLLMCKMDIYGRKRMRSFCCIETDSINGMTMQNVAL